MARVGRSSEHMAQMRARRQPVAVYAEDHERLQDHGESCRCLCPPGFEFDCGGARFTFRHSLRAD